MHKAVKPQHSRRFNQMHKRFDANPEQPAPGLTTRLGQHAKRDNATEKQLAYIRNLMAERNLTDQQQQAAEAQLADGITKTQASAWIERLKALPRQHSPQRAVGDTVDRPNLATSESARGMYRAPDGTIIRVYLGQQSGRNLCKKLVDTGQPHPEDSSINLHDWEYLGAAQYKLPSGSTRMTLAEAKEFGRMTGHCCRCGRRLDVPESVEAGIGPVCAKRGEWA